jgi:serine/threonine-protein kinase
VSIEFDETLSPEAWSDRLVTLPVLKDLGSTLVERPRSTIEPRFGGAAIVNDKARAALVHGMSTLESGAMPRSGLPGFEVKETLGEGGMGIVRVAEQTALGRKVAIKTLKDEHLKDFQASMRILREAWITGRVEHPNVLPIYDLGTDDLGRPHIVMRKVEGASWDTLLTNPDEVRKVHGAKDLHDFHLRVFLSVCQAVGRAHASGIVHRDIKPENVMIGGYGEVYLLDWGIAVSLIEDPEGRLPLARDAKEAAGTPCYMAPEMLGSGNTPIDERTDVYLLGATLYEVVVGRPPHEGASFVEMVKSIVFSQPAFPEDCPRELAAICSKAMQRIPAARHASVQELRVAVEDYLTHRGSTELASEASQKREELEKLLSGVDAVERQEVYNLFGAARFGYFEALRSWPENDEAREGLRAISERIIDYELGSGSAEAAHAVLAEMSQPSPELVARVEAAMVAREAEKRRLEKLSALEAEYDPNVGRRTRLFVGVVLAGVGVVLPLVVTVVHCLSPQRDAPTPFGTLLQNGALTAIASGFVYWARDSLGRTKLNRSIAASSLAGFIFQLLLVPGCVALGLGMKLHTAITLLSWAGLMAIVGITSERKFVWPALAYFAGFFVAARYTEFRYAAFAFGNVASLVVVVSAWSTPDDLVRLRARAKNPFAPLVR